MKNKVWNYCPDDVDIIRMSIVYDEKGEAVAVKKDKIQLKDDKIASLREQVKKLEDDKKKLIVQLVDYEELKSENERLKKQLAKK